MAIIRIIFFHFPVSYVTELDQSVPSYSTNLDENHYVISKVLVWRVNKSLGKSYKQIVCTLSTDSKTGNLHINITLMLVRVTTVAVEK
jgi:hypothetical protein